MQEILKQSSLAVRRLLLQYEEYQLLTDLIAVSKDQKEKELLLIDRAQVGAEMTFANHIIWLMYKHTAYQNTNKALHNLADLEQHCAPVDDICHKRWHFLVQHLQTQEALFQPTLSLADLYQYPKVLALLDDYEFMKAWKGYEFYRVDGKIRKWQNYLC